MIKRLRRLRKNERIRKLVRETLISKDFLIYPIFIKEGSDIYEEISSMKGQYRYSIDKLYIILDELKDLGIYNILLFGIPSNKDECGSEAFLDKGIMAKAIRYIKKEYPEFYLISDVCMCEYTSHGHCGIVHDNDVDNDITLKYLAKIAISHVQAGVDMIAPSDMMDGRIGYIRKELDSAGYIDVPIMSYSAKYVSGFYSPFREAADSAPKNFDRKTYQMDYHNSKEALREIELDIEEGADIIMIKPSMAYLDIISLASEKFNIPIATYSVSGEYAMLKLSFEAGILDENKILKEVAISAFRAGTNIYITYFAKEIAKLIDKGEL